MCTILSRELNTNYVDIKKDSYILRGAFPEIEYFTCRIYANTFRFALLGIQAYSNKKKNHYFTFISKREQLTFTESWPISGFIIFLNFILIKAISFLILSNRDFCCDTYYYMAILYYQNSNQGIQVDLFFPSGHDT